MSEIDPIWSEIFQALTEESKDIPIRPVYIARTGEEVDVIAGADKLLEDYCNRETFSESTLRISKNAGVCALYLAASAGVCYACIKGVVPYMTFGTP